MKQPTLRISKFYNVKAFAETRMGSSSMTEPNTDWVGKWGIFEQYLENGRPISGEKRYYRRLIRSCTWTIEWHHSQLS